MLNNNNEYNPDVLTCLANLSNDEVFTPPFIANQMLDTLPKELWRDPNAKFLDPFTKSGIFLREIAKRLIEGLKDYQPDLQKRIDHIMHHQLYGIGITELTAYLSRRSLYCSTRANGKHSVSPFDTEQGNIFYQELAHTFERGKCIYCGINDKELNEDNREGRNQFAYPFIHNLNPYENMKFDVIIGNPPYQMSDGGGGNGSSAKPIYHTFIQQAIKLDPKYLVMITPSRWFAGGKGLDDFRDEMLKENRLKEIHDYLNEKEVFPTIQNIRGGVNYFLWDRNYRGDCLIKTYENGKVISEMKRPLKEEGLEVFIRYNEAVKILYKIKKNTERNFSEMVSSHKPFGLRSFVKGNSSPYKNEDSVKLYQTKSVGYYKKSDIPKNQQWIEAHKIFVPKAIGSGDMNDVVNPIYGEPNTACTETYLVIGPFRDKQRCENVISYINTKFFHFMFGLKKITQNTSKGTYQFVPLQDFSKPWTDAELYEKYNLTQEEIDYIESVVWANKKEK